MGFLSNDSPLGRMFGRVGDIIIVNLLFVLCSLPVLTIGASLCAMNFVLLKKRKGDEVPVVGTFFAAFKENFKQGTITWLITLAVGALLYTYIRFFGIDGPSPTPFLYYLFIILAVMVLFIVIWLFPAIASFRGSVRDLFARAFFFMSKNLPLTFVMAGLWILPVVFTFYNTAFMITGVTIWICFGFGLITWIDAYFI